MSLKKIIYKIKINKRNVFSTVAGLKGYSVGRKKYPATLRGYSRANKEFIRGGVGSKLHYEY